jgi:hypothetical protein
MIESILKLANFGFVKPFTALIEQRCQGSMLDVIDGVLEFDLSLIDRQEIDSSYKIENTVKLVAHQTKWLKSKYLSWYPMMDARHPGKGFDEKPPIELVEKINQIDALLDIARAKKLELLLPTLDNNTPDPSREERVYICKVVVNDGRTGEAIYTPLRYSLEPSCIDIRYLEEVIYKVPYYWHGKSGFSEIYYSDKEVVEVVAIDPSFEGLDPLVYGGWQLDKVFTKKASLNREGYKEY